MSKELLLQFTAVLQNVIDETIASAHPPSEVQDIYNTLMKKRTIQLEESVKLLKWVDGHSNTLKEIDIMKNSNLILPTLPVRNRSPELEKRLILLKRQQEEKEYNKMVENISRKSMEVPSQNYKAPMISGLNFAITFLATVFGTTYVLQSIIPNLAIRISIGVVVGSLLLTVEIILALRAISND